MVTVNEKLGGIPRGVSGQHSSAAVHPSQEEEPPGCLESRRASSCNLEVSIPVEQVWGSPPLQFAEAYTGIQDQKHKTSDRYTMNVGKFPNQMTIYLRILQVDSTNVLTRQRKKKKGEELESNE